MVLEFTWIRPLNLFIKRNQHPHSKDDLNALCSLLGPQGVRAINCKIGIHCRLYLKNKQTI